MFHQTFFLPIQLAQNAKNAKIENVESAEILWSYVKNVSPWNKM